MTNMSESGQNAGPTGSDVTVTCRLFCACTFQRVGALSQMLNNVYETNVGLFFERVRAHGGISAHNVHSGCCIEFPQIKKIPFELRQFCDTDTFPSCRLQHVLYRIPSALH